MMRTSLALFDRVRYEHSDEILCARCHVPLERHQPDNRHPDRLLGTCCECGLWHLIRERTGEVIVLPEFWAAPRPKK